MGVRGFAEKVKKAVSERLGEDYQIKVQEVSKNNGVILQGLVILTESQNISPTIYLNSFWEAYEAGVPFAAIVEKILSVYQEDTPKENVDMSFFKCFDKVKDRICFKLISAEQNLPLLEKIPHEKYLDLAICFYYAYQGATLGCGSILIHNSHMEMWQVDTEQLWKAAQENTPKLFPWECSSLENVLMEILSDEDESEEGGSDERELDEAVNSDAGNESDMGKESDEENCAEEIAEMIPMRILSNKERVFGASSILYPGILQEIAEKEECNFYIIPSSIHEVILLTDGGEEDSEYLRNMIAEVNNSQVEPEEVLSNQLYYYDRLSKRVTIV